MPQWRFHTITLDSPTTIEEIRRKQYPWELLVPTPVAPSLSHTHLRLNDPSGAWVAYAVITGTKTNGMKTWVYLGPVEAVRQVGA